MTESQLLRKQADMMDMAEKYKIDDWRKLVLVDYYGRWEMIKSLPYYFNPTTKRRFAVGVVEDKIVFEGDTLFCDGLPVRISAMCNFDYHGWSWKQQLPTLTIELTIEDIKYWTHLGYSQGGNLSGESINYVSASKRFYEACNEALKELNKR